MSWETSSYTKAGAALLSESISGGALTITRAVSGTGTAETDLSAETVVSGETHGLNILAIDTVADNGQTARKVSIQITGTDSPYIMHQVGVYGRLNNEEEVLLFIMQDERGIEVPSSGANAEFEIEISVLLAVSDKANIGITLSPQMQAIMRMVQQYIREHCVQLNSYSLTLAADGWTPCNTAGYPYRYTAPLSAAQETDMPTAQPAISSLVVAEDAGLASVCETANGAITFWAETVPAGDIQMQVTLLGQGKDGTVVDTTSMLGQAILGSLVLNS